MKGPRNFVRFNEEFVETMFVKTKVHCNYEFSVFFQILKETKTYTLNRPTRKIN